ncbi:Choline-sulfatase [Caulifigura coniformis]|uniref:Choline-sulfatase n=1 Tax=Caulifigura coniformis TaxID=2527983 RepID=A0A517SCT9_9PLAN|nr:sulfatase [Caulifigura coniformis]QDT53950.1 Choline-sulfatase [Caulifigura coniformis]
MIRLLALVLVATLLAAAPSVAADRPPNIVVFLADDLGAHDLGCTGSSFYETPNLDRLASQGARFTQAYAACPVCSPSRASLMTGKWPVRTGVTDYIGAPQPDKWKRNTRLLPAPYQTFLDLRETTLAEVCKSAGYATMHAGKWHLGPEANWPEHQGFDVNKGGHSAGGPYGPGKYFSPYGNPRLEDGPAGEHLPDRLARECSAFIRENKDRPFYVNFWTYDVHTPLMARKDLLAKYEAKRSRLGLEPKYGREGSRDVRLVQEHAVYAAMVDAMDDAVGQVLRTLDELKLADDTLVIFTSDNGGLSTSEGWPTSNLPLRGGKGWLYEGGIRVPLLVRWPGKTTPGSVIDTPAVTPDLFATVAAAVGKPTKSDGIDLAPVLRGELSSRPLYWHYPHYGNQGGAPGSAIRVGNLKLIAWDEGGIELFDLAADPGETSPLDDRTRMSELIEKLILWKEQVGARSPTPNPGFDPAKPTGRGTKNPTDPRG